MSEKIANNYVGLVNYQELESNILSSIREGRPLTGRDGALTPLIKKLLEASLEGEMESHLSNKIGTKKTIAETAKTQRLYEQVPDHSSC